MSAQKRTFGKKKRENKINLLPRGEFAESTIGRVLAWLVSTFRTIVVVVELIVMLAFLSRFYLDAKVTDLNEEIDSAKVVIESYSDFENEFRDAQERLAIFKEASKNSGVATTTIDNIARSLPPDLLLSTISLEESEVNLSGISPSEQSISQFIVNLEAQRNVSEVLLTSLTQEGIVLEFNISIKYGN